MSHQDNERERLKKLRDRQLSARNPGKTDSRIMKQVARRGQRKQKKVTFSEMVRDLPHKWRGLFLGAVAGMFLWLLLYVLAEGMWIDLVGIFAIVFLAVLGFALGQAFDARDELKRL